MNATAVREPTRWGILGVGDVCRFKSGPAFAKVPNSEVIAVCRRTPGAAEQYARENNVSKFYTNAADLVKDEDVNAIYVCTPPDSHLELGLLVAAAGKPCLMEKPLGRNAMESAAIAAAFERSGVPLFVAYYRRAWPRYLTARDLLSKIGAVKSVRAKVRRYKEDEGWRCDRTRSGGGYVVDVGSHVVDILDFLLGPILLQGTLAGRKTTGTAGSSEVMRNKGRKDAENYCLFEFSMPLQHRAACGSCEFDFAYKDGDVQDEIRIEGEVGSITFAALGLYGSDPTVTLESKNGKQVIEVSNPQHAHQPLIEQVVRTLRGEKEGCTATSAAAVRAAVIIDSALESSNLWPRGSMQSYTLDA